MLAEFGGEAEAGIHAHQNLSLAVANTMVAFAEGATLADACLAGAGAGAGNCQLEALVAVMEKAGMGTGIDLWTLEDIADQVVRPIMTTPPIVDRATLTQGFAGVPGSFLHHAFSAADRFGVDAARHPGRGGPPEVRRRAGGSRHRGGRAPGRDGAARGQLRTGDGTGGPPAGGARQPGPRRP